MENVIIAVYENESTTYQVLSELKNRTGSSTVLVAGAIQNIGGSVVIKDGWSNGDSGTSWASGGLIGGLVGMLGGPVGMLMGGSLGMLVGSVADADDAMDDNSIIQKVAHDLKDQHLALIVLAQEESPLELDGFLTHYGSTQIIRRDVAAVQAEIYQAEEAQKELQKQARAKMREEKKTEWRQKAADVQSKIKQDIEKVKEKL